MRRTLLTLVLAGVLAGVAACSSEPVAEAPPFRIVASTGEIMHGIVIPNSDVIWGSVMIIVDENGEQHFQPETDEEWQEVSDRAMGLAESSNLLLMPERAQGREPWIEYTLEMSDKAVAASEAALLRDADQLLFAGGELYEACAKCHEEYDLRGL
jgi:hypothetical protein